MKEHQITVCTRDQKHISFHCGSDENLLSAAERQEIFLPSQCHNGNCGACVAQVDIGSYALNDPTNEILSEPEKEDRKVLLCQTTPKSALDLTLPYDYDFIRFEKLTTRRATIHQIKKIAFKTWHLLLDLDSDPVYGQTAEFEAGQYMEIKVPEATDLWRAYSLVNITNWAGRLEFIIEERTNGHFSSYLKKANPGDKLSIRGPLGTFILQENGLHPRWFIGGGTGVAPLLSMLRRMAEWEDNQPAKLYFGVHAAQDLFFTEQIEKLKKQLPQLEIKYCVSDRKTRKNGHYDNVIKTLTQDLKTTKPHPDCYVCGSSRLLNGVIEAVQKKGISRNRIYSERFIST